MFITHEFLFGVDQINDRWLLTCFSLLQKDKHFSGWWLCRFAEWLMERLLDCFSDWLVDRLLYCWISSWFICMRVEWIAQISGRFEVVRNLVWSITQSNAVHPFLSTLPVTAYSMALQCTRALICLSTWGCQHSARGMASQVSHVILITGDISPVSHTASQALHCILRCDLQTLRVHGSSPSQELCFWFFPILLSCRCQGKWRTTASLWAASCLRELLPMCLRCSFYSHMHVLKVMNACSSKC